MHRYEKKTDERNPSGRENQERRWWLRRKQCIFLVMSVVITITLLRFGGPPAYVAITHIHALNCGGPKQLEVFKSYPQGDPVAISAARCFVQARQRCQAATMSTFSLTPSSTSLVTFLTANHLGSCSLSIEIRDGQVGEAITTRRLDCMGLAHKIDGLHFLNCGSMKDEVFSFSF
jgi:hypothetical protein